MTGHDAGAPAPAEQLGLIGLHHLGLTVRDAESSADWYTTVLGFRRTGDHVSPDGARRKVFLEHDHVPARLGLTEHRSADGSRFDETRVGLDHLAFGVRDRSALESWVEVVAAAGVVHSPIAAANSIPGAFVLVLRDPDNIQVELFCEPATAHRDVVGRLRSPGRRGPVPGSRRCPPR